MSVTASPLPGTDIRILSLGLIVITHAALLYAGLNGVNHPVTLPTVPREVIATLITPEQVSKPQLQPPPMLLEPQPMPKIAPKPPSVIKKTVAPKPEPRPRTAPEPMEKSIGAPTPPLPPVAVAASAPEPQAAAAPAAPSLLPEPVAPKTVSGVEYVEPPQPAYPPIAKRMGEEGKVMLRVLVSERGRPEKVDVQMSSGYARLDEAARQAALRAVFKPHLEDGQAVAVYALIPINFSIQ